MPTRLQSPLGDSVISRSGALYESKKYYNGYQIIEFDRPSNCAIFKCRTYFDYPRRRFGASESLGSGGLFPIVLSPKANSQALSDVELFLSQARPLIRRKADCQINFAITTAGEAGFGIEEAFVCPTLTKHSASDNILTAGTKKSHQAVAVEELLRSREHIIITGQPESGRTSLIHYLAVRVAEGLWDTPRIPVILSLAFLAHSRPRGQI
jgi:hypothetical protein